MVEATALPDTRTRLLDAALLVIRTKGYAGTSVDDLCQEAGVTKGAFFHHFKSKEDMAVAAAAHFGAMAEGLFSQAGYRTLSDPLERLLAYVDFRKSILAGTLPEFTCLLGTLVQEAYETHPAIAAAANRYISEHASTLEADISAVMATRGSAADLDGGEPGALHASGDSRGLHPGESQGRASGGGGLPQSSQLLSQTAFQSQSVKGERHMATQPRKIFVNLPVKNLDRSMTFFKALGFSFNAQFTDETSASMVISDNIYATLVTHEKFKEFSNKPIADASQDHRSCHLPFGGEPGRGEQNGRCGVKGGRPETAGAAGLRLHVFAQFPGPGRAYLGDHVDGSCQRKII